MRLLVARCEVVYTGRLTARLREAVRVLMFKATWGKWSPLMYAPEIGLISGIVVASVLRRHPGRWICSLGFVGAALCVFAVFATNSGATWQMPLP